MAPAVDVAKGVSVSLAVGCIANDRNMVTAGAPPKCATSATAALASTRLDADSVGCAGCGAPI